MTQFILYDAANSPCGRRVRMTLLEKNVEFEIRWLALGLMEQKQPWYLQLNPSGLVPTLVHGDRSVFDSNVINEYLDNILPGEKLIPAQTSLQAEMRMWMAFEMEWAKPFRDAIYQSYAKVRLQQTGMDTEMLVEEIQKRTSNPVYIRTAIGLLNDSVDDTLLKDRVDILMERMAWMENRLSDGRSWLLGDSFSLADITLAPRLDMFPFIGVPDLYARYPHIGRFMQGVKQRPSWQQSEIFPVPGNSGTLVTPSNNMVENIKK